MALTLAAHEPDHAQPRPVRLLDRRGAGPQRLASSTPTRCRRPSAPGSGPTSTSTWSPRPTAATSSTGSPRSLGQVLKAYYDSIGVPDRGERRGRRPLRRRVVQRDRRADLRRGRRRQRGSRPRPRWPSGAAPSRPSTPATTASCDTYPSNISDTVLNRAGDAAAHALWTLATGTAGDDRLLGHLRDRHRLDDQPERHRHRHHRRLGARRPGRHHLQRRPSSWAPRSAASTTSSPARLAGTDAGDFDVDGGVTTDPVAGHRAARERHAARWRCRWYLAHGSTTPPARTSSASRSSTVAARTTLFTQAGAAANRNGAWATGVVEPVGLRRAVGADPVFEAADASDGEPGRGRRRRRPDHRGLAPRQLGGR